MGIIKAKCEKFNEFKIFTSIEAAIALTIIILPFRRVFHWPFGLVITHV